MREKSIFSLPASGSSAGVEPAWHAHNEAADQRAWYPTPAIFQRSTKAIPLFCSSYIIIILWIELIHAPFKMVPEVLNRVEIR
jgi:hypothetical protein